MTGNDERPPGVPAGASTDLLGGRINTNGNAAAARTTDATHNDWWSDRPGGAIDINTATVMVVDAFPGAAIVNTDDDDVTAWALRYASKGWRTVRLQNKNPKRNGKGYQHRASAHPPEVLRQFSAKWVNGVGIMVPDDIVVVDVDPRNGGDVTWADYADTHGEPGTLKSVSGRGDGGFHLYFQRPNRPLVSERDGIDVKASGLVVAPPSVHPDGPPSVHPAFGNRYWWVNWGTPVAPMPGPLVDLLAKPAAPAADDAAGVTDVTPQTGRGAARSGGGPDVLKAFAVLDWSHIWPAKWTRAVDHNGHLISGQLFDEPAELWLRPGGTSTHSATCGSEWCHVWSTGVPGLDAGGHTKAQVYAWANGITASELARQLYAQAREVRHAS